MARSEPFRALLEEAFSDEGVPLPASIDKPKTLERRLDQVSLAGHGATPARGTAISPVLRLESGLSTPAPPPVLEAPETLATIAPVEVSAAARDLLDELDTTAKLERPAAIDAALQDALAEPPVTMPIPSIFRQPTLNVPAQSLVPARSDDVSEPVPAAPRKDRGGVQLPRPPPLPAKGKPKLVDAKLVEPRPVLATVGNPADNPADNLVDNLVDTKPTLEVKPVEIKTLEARPAARSIETVAPVPKIVQVLEDVTIPGIQRPGSSSNSNNSGRMISATDLYRLQLEFEDTPARPLPALASLPPPTPLRGVEMSGKLNALSDIEDIADLDALAQALGLEGVGDVSIPSAEGLLSDNEVQQDWNDVTDELPMLEEIEEIEELDDAILEVAPAIQKVNATPVIVKIPSRPKVSVEAREQARRLYLSAVDELGRGDRFAAIGHLRLAVHYDDGIQLYKELLDQLEKTDAKEKSEPTPKAPKSKSGLMVVSSNGMTQSPPRDRWRVGR